MYWAIKHTGGVCVCARTCTCAHPYMCMCTNGPIFHTRGYSPVKVGFLHGGDSELTEVPWKVKYSETVKPASSEDETFTPTCLGVVSRLTESVALFVQGGFMVIHNC